MDDEDIDDENTFRPIAVITYIVKRDRHSRQLWNSRFCCITQLNFIGSFLNLISKDTYHKLIFIVLRMTGLRMSMFDNARTGTFQFDVLKRFKHA